MATSARDFFETRLPEALRAHPERAAGVAALYLFRISGDDGGTWTVDLASTPPTCTSGSKGQPQCTIDVSDRDLSAMIDGGVQAAMQVLMAGRLKITGDSTLISKLMKLLQTSL